MSLWEILLLGVSLSMDAFAVSICQGLSLKSFSLKHVLTIGLWYGGFQFLMPTVGFFLSSRYADMIASFDHWIAFGLLFLIGANMIREALFEKDEEKKLSSSLAFFLMLKLAIATSIDALAVGVSLAMIQDAIIFPALLIGLTTFTISALGVSFGKLIETKFSSKAEIAGGVVLILLGVKILIEHLFLNKA